MRQPGTPVAGSDPLGRSETLSTSNGQRLSDIRFMTVEEVALIMRISKMTVYRLIHTGELEAVQVGRSFRVPEQAVDQYLKASFVVVGTAS
jgi:excisionase family DNA binding protein